MSSDIVQTDAVVSVGIPAPEEGATETAIPAVLEAPKAAPANPAAVEPVTFAPTGSPGLDLGLEFIGRLGIGMEHSAMQEASKGNFEPIEAVLAELGDKATGFEKVLAVVRAAFTEQQAREAKRSADNIEAIHSAVGGGEMWAKVSAWAGETATAEERTDVNSILAKGGFLAVMVAKGLGEGYARATKSTTPGSVLTQTATGKGEVLSALNLKQFTLEVEKLHKLKGADMEGSGEYRALRARLKT